MLVHLQIRDLAIIDAVELELGAGLTALTGETGAGKSILVDAVLLAIGGRAGADLLRHGAERAEVTATFDLRGNTAARAWLEEQALADDVEDLVLRRVIGADGRSRQYINGQTFPAQAVRALGDTLIEIHGQQEYLSLQRRDAQRDLVDGHGALEPLAAPVRELARAWRTLAAERAGLASAASERAGRLELLRYQVQELEALALADGEVETLLAERARHANRGRLAEAGRNALALAFEGDGADAHALAARAVSQLRAAAALDPGLVEALRLLEEAVIGLGEAGTRLAGWLEALDADPARQDQVERRVAALEELARKHRIAAAGLPQRLVELRQELAALEQSGVTLADLDRRLAETSMRYRSAAAALSTARRHSATELAASVTNLMKGLGMPGGRFEIAVEPAADTDPAPDGVDRIEFQVSANPGQPVRPVGRVASGGELSRISLAVQVAAADQRAQGCMIFDEVDAGIGGGVAEIVGRQLRRLGERGQVLCVTHLPQVASQAHHQLRVAKLTDGRSTRTTVVALGADERVEELARMLGGVAITRKAREHAREMLRGAGSA
ncbi:MAG: DNA repair protein RecN [Gammaproteobacteria bacterium]|nr:MAG: DNA repair protein RecN [Gammaproteobacteria bacterium]